jgi:GntR family transcriptional regulator
MGPDPPGRATSLDRRDPLPLWAQLTAELRRRLEAGDFNERFPTDRELTEAYGVSRQTAREAVRRLGEQGLLERSRGRGTFLRTREFEQPLGTLYSLFRAIEAQGVEQRSIVRVLDIRTDADAAAHLGVPPDARLFYLERIRLAGDEPLALDRAWLPAEVAEPLLAVDFSRTALYDELARHCGIHLTGGQERLHPVVPDRALRQALRVRTGEAVFAIERLARAGARLIEFRSSFVRGGRYGFVVAWENGSGYNTTMAVQEVSPR